MQDKFLRLEQVSEVTGLARSTIYAKVKTGTFPKHYKPHGCVSAWSALEVQEWLNLVKANHSEKSA